MLKNAWYLITHDDFLHDPAAPPPPTDAHDLADLLHTVFGDDTAIAAARTHTAVRTMIAGAEHLSDAVGHFHDAIGNDAQAARLLAGINLLCAHLAQSSGPLAHHVGARTIGADLTDAERRVLTDALATACRRFEDAAGLFKEAHLTLTSPRRSGQPHR